jgi:acyl phosphate:glycerol-3-phosphate acyltransferase
MIDPLGGPAYWLPFVIAFACGYLAGSVPFGLLLAKLGGAGDIRSIGSGNIGATNVLRTGRKGLALATLLFDIAKGCLPTLVAFAWLGPDIAIAVGLGTVLGHCFPVWLRFRGGKGVATAAGVILALTPLVVPIILALFVAIVWATRYVSLGSCLAAVAAPLPPGCSAMCSPPSSTSPWHWSSSSPIAPTSAASSRARRASSASPPRSSDPLWVGLDGIDVPDVPVLGLVPRRDAVVLLLVEVLEPQAAEQHGEAGAIEADARPLRTQLSRHPRRWPAKRPPGTRAAAIRSKRPASTAGRSAKKRQKLALTRSARGRSSSRRVPCASPAVGGKPRVSRHPARRGPPVRRRRRARASLLPTAAGCRGRRRSRGRWLGARVAHRGSLLRASHEAASRGAAGLALPRNTRAILYPQLIFSPLTASIRVINDGGACEQRRLSS